MVTDDRPVNPPDTMTIVPGDEGFSIDTNNMDVGRMYRLEYQGGIFETERLDNGALAMCRVVTARDWPRLALIALTCILRRRQMPSIVRRRCGGVGTTQSCPMPNVALGGI